MPQKTIEINCKDDEQVHIWKGSKKYLSEPYMRMYQDGFLLIIKDRELTYTDLRVYLGLLAYTDFDNKILVSQKTLANEIGIKQSHVSLTIKKLCQKKIIIHTGNVGSQKIYYLNPEIGFKARAKRLGYLTQTIKNGEAPEQNNFIPTEIYQEEIPKSLWLEKMSKLMNKPIEEVEEFFKAWSVVQMENESES